jgi:hypothetical protein
MRHAFLTKGAEDVKVEPTLAAYGMKQLLVGLLADTTFIEEAGEDVNA